MEEQIELLIAYAEQYGIFFLVPLILLENIPVIGLIAPGVTVLFLAGFFSSVLPGGPIIIFLMIFGTMVLADTFWYGMGYKYGIRLPILRYIKEKSPNIKSTITSQPIYILMLYQFIPYLRMFLPFTLGLYGYSPKKWLKTTIIGSFLFTSAYISLGIGAAIWYDNIDDSNAIFGMPALIATILTTGFTIRFAIKYVEHRRLRKLVDIENEKKKALGDRESK